MALCLKHFLNAGAGPSSCGHCKNCPNMTPCMSNHYCETCSRLLVKCHSCGQPAIYEKTVLLAALEQKKEKISQENKERAYSYNEAEIQVINAQIENIDSFTSLEDALELRGKVMDKYYEDLRKAHSRKV